MYAIIEDSGTQIKVSNGDVIDIDKRDLDGAETLTFDKVLMVGLFVAMAVIGILPGVWSLFLVLTILSREFLITGLRLVAASSGVVLAAEKAGKRKTVSQMVAAIILLLVEAIRHDFPGHLPDSLIDGFYWSGIGFFLLATVLTVSSGLAYMIKYWSLFTGEEENKNE